MSASIETVINKLKNHFGNNPIKIIEIGARFGDSTIVMLNHLNVCKYYIIDPYTSYLGYESDGFDSILKDNNSGDEIYESVKILVENYPVEIIREFSDNVYKKFDKDSIDLIFIDGNHEYEYVLNDIKNYFPKLKIGGIICGDDYFMRHHRNDWNNSGNQYPMDMVYEAVQEYYKNTKYTIQEFGIHSKYAKTWLVEK